jgi:hypothetical protein
MNMELIIRRQKAGREDGEFRGAIRHMLEQDAGKIGFAVGLFRQYP